MKKNMSIVLCLKKRQSILRKFALYFIEKIFLREKITVNPPKIPPDRFLTFEVTF